MIAGQLLHSINAGAEHVVTCTDFGDGKVGVRESMPMEATGLLDRVDQRMPLADVFRTIQPGAEVPKSLLAADARMALARLNMPAQPLEPQLSVWAKRAGVGSGLDGVADRAPPATSRPFAAPRSR